MPGRPGRNSTDASEACQAWPQPIPECLCHRHRGERRGHRTSEKTIIFTPPSLRKRSHFFFLCPGGDWEGKQAESASLLLCSVLFCGRFCSPGRRSAKRYVTSDVLHADASRREDRNENRREQRSFVLSEKRRKSLCICLHCLH